MEGQRDLVHWDPGAGEVEITTGNRSVAVRGLGESVQFDVETDDGDTRRAIWLSAEQADVLGRMIKYAIGLVDSGSIKRVRPGSRDTLQAILEDVTALWPNNG